ncbi:hypothetical protein [Flavobacterium sp. ASV13]|uniref:hypothetical protein n=1 Tax=Flavobacterium sp. ASV13 TaxID=1506583 RepID=UPI0005511F0E|nr:hypothetical protein [Flavobacterium sp. ASV13]
MKTFLKLILLAFIFSGCNQNVNQKIENAAEKDTITKTKKTITEPVVDSRKKNTGDLDQLFPIDILNPKSKDVFKKYGIEFTGNCYACDLAIVSISEKRFKITNVCDDKTTQEFEITEFSGSDDLIEFKTKQNNFILTKIDKAPVYELKITGDSIKIKNLRISKFYTTQKMLDKFEEHDCGDFQG